MKFSSESTITIHFKDGGIEEFSIFSLSRWLALIEAFEFIQEFADNNHIDIDKCDFIRKPASIYEFINAKQPKIEEVILSCCNHYKINTDYLFELI